MEYPLCTFWRYNVDNPTKHTPGGRLKTEGKIRFYYNSKSSIHTLGSQHPDYHTLLHIRSLSSIHPIGQTLYLRHFRLIFVHQKTCYFCRFLAQNTHKQPNSCSNYRIFNVFSLFFISTTQKHSETPPFQPLTVTFFGDQGIIFDKCLKYVVWSAIILIKNLANTKITHHSKETPPWNAKTPPSRPQTLSPIS